MKILFLTENFPPETNAAATRVYERACYWTKWGHEVTVITCAPNFPEGKVFEGYENKWHQVEERSGIRVVRVKTFISANQGVILRTLDFLSFMAAAIPAGLVEERPDVICATSPQFFTAVGGCALAALRRIPFVFELGDLWPASVAAVGAVKQKSLVRGVELLELFLYRQSAAVIALTNAFKENLVSRGIPADKIGVVINGVDLPRYAPRPRDAELDRQWGLEGKFVIGYVGTHGMAHDLKNVLDAAELLRAEPRLRFLFVGAGAEREALIADAKKRQLDNVLFIPIQPKELMPRIWSLCNVALVHLKNSPTFADVIPSKIFEAMGMARPVLLVSPDGEARRIVANAGAGLCVPAGDPAALAEASRRLLASPELCEELGRKSHQAAPQFTRETQARRVIQVFESVVAGRGHQAAHALA